MHMHVRERHLPHVVEAGDHHPRDPQRDDVATRDQHVAGIKLLQDGIRSVPRRVGTARHRWIRRLVRPTQRGVRPERRTEPGVEHVGVAAQFVPGPQHVRGKVRLRANQPIAVLRIAQPMHIVPSGEGALQVRFGACGTVPNGDLVTPPQLPADAPVRFSESQSTYVLVYRAG